MRRRLRGITRKIDVTKMAKDLRTFLILVIFSAASFGCQSTPSTTTPPTNAPNIVVILADDLGYADVGFLGSDTVRTPHIDKLASEGVAFTHGYVTASVCGPTRAGLLTGRYQQRFGSEDNPAPYKLHESVRVGVPPSEKLISERLKARGYATAVFGKWHLGGERGDEGLMPINRGFDEFFGFLEGAALYFDENNTEEKFMRGNALVESENRYLTDAIGDESLRFIEENKDAPFFLYLPFSSVHAPLQATADDLAKFRHVKSERRRTLLAMLHAMDRNVGRVLDKIETEGLESNTLIFFLSDNGGQPTDNYSYNMPLRGTKGSYYEGGIRVPFAVKWPGKVPQGKIYALPVSSLDIAATIFSAVGLAEPTNSDELQIDGVNMLEYLGGARPELSRRYLFWKMVNHRAVRDAEWKLVQHGETKELFNLADDPSERRNVLDERPDVVARLESAYLEWDRQNIPAQYGYDRNVFPVLDKRTRRTEFER